MNTIARLNDEDRKFIFLKTSEATGKSVAIVEKDYWIIFLQSHHLMICWFLKAGLLYLRDLT